MMRRRTWITLIAFTAALTATAVFGFRAYRHAPRPAVDEPIRPWMNVLYIAHSYDVPPHVLLETLELPRKPPDKRPIEQIAEAQGVTVEQLTAELMQAIQRSRQEHDGRKAKSKLGLPPELQSDGPL